MKLMWSGSVQCANTGCLPTLHPALPWTAPHLWLQLIFSAKSSSNRPQCGRNWTSSSSACLFASWFSFHGHGFLLYSLWRSHFEWQLSVKQNPNVFLRFITTSSICYFSSTLLHLIPWSSRWVGIVTSCVYIVLHWILVATYTRKSTSFCNIRMSSSVWTYSNAPWLLTCFPCLPW